MKRLLLVSLISSLLALSPGSSPLAFGGDCGCGVAAPAPVATCDACEPCAPCASCCRPCCDPIRGVLELPLKAIDWVAHLGCGACCDNGCGERYWGEWSEPVDCCDPCDNCGNWVGHVGRPYGGAPVAGYAKSAPRPTTYAQRSTQSHNPVNAEFGLDPAAKVLSRSDRVVAPAQAGRPMTAQANQPHRAPARR